MSSTFLIDDGMLLSYFNQELSAKQARNVEAWLSIPANQHYYEQLQMIWHLGASNLPKAIDTHAAYQKVKQRIDTKSTHRNRLNVYYKVAASFLLLLACYYSVRQISFHKSATDTSVVASTENKKNPVSPTQVTLPPSLPDIKQETDVTLPVEEKHQETGMSAVSKNPETQFATVHSKEEICNNTTCPLEICIVQTLNCDGKASTFAHCSLLQPDQSGAVHYKRFNTGNCDAPVKQITIRRTTTGETIVLNDTSKVTAGDFFDYITGSKTGDIVAGIFETDCDNRCSDQSIQLDNRHGMPVLR